MTQEQFVWLQLVAKVGTNAAISILDGIKNAKTIDDAIAALKESQKVEWSDFKKAEQT